MKKFKAEFTLKQHTPIIHFQSNQRGATLRATELKPKFDRFLLENVKGIPYIENANKSKSLDYKVKIEQNFSQAQEINSRESLYFGNMGDGEEKKFKTYPRPFTIEFFSYNREVLEAIKSNFEAFLANTNFGTRQSKGYGGFYIDGKSFDTKLIAHKIYSFSSNNWEKDIKVLYPFLRQGINRVNHNGDTVFYSKPAIFSYAKSKGWEWDKKAIKQEYFSNQLQKQIKDYKPSDILEYSSENQYLLRDLFGLSSSQEWGKPYYTTIEKEGTKIENINGKNEIVVQRFRSPITFKIVNNRVCFWANDTVNSVLGEDFSIKDGRGDESLHLSFPTEFSFEDFFTFAFNIDLSIHIQPKYHNQSEYTILTKILNELKSLK